MKFPDIFAPLNIRLLWFDITDKKTSDRRTYRDAHSHDFFEIHFVLSGEAYYTSGNEKFNLNENFALFIPKGVVHHYLGCTDSILKVSLAFLPSDKGDNADFLTDITTKKFLFGEDIARNSDFILKNCENDDIFSPYIISNKILEMLFSACGSMKIPLPKRKNEDVDERFLQACKYIRDNRSALISCDEVAKACGLSPKQLGRIFMKNSGIALSEYIIRERINHAKKLLAEKDLTIKQAGYALGFENPSSFVSFFKRHCGKSPKSYREDHPDRPENE